MGPLLENNELRTLTNVIPHQIWTATPDGNLDYFNEQWFLYSEWTYEQSQGQGWAKAIHPEDLQHLVNVWTNALLNIKPYQVTARVLKHDNTYRWHNIHALPIFDNAGQVQRWIGTNTDIHEQKMLEEELKNLTSSLQKSNSDILNINQGLEATVEYSTIEAKKALKDAERERNKLYRFFMQAPSAIVILEGPDLIFDLVNPAYQALFPGRALKGKPVLDALPEIKDTLIENVLKQVYATGKSFEGNEYPISLGRYDQNILEDLYFNFIYQPKFNEYQEVDGILVFAFEVTDMVRSRQKVEESKRVIENISEELAASNEEIKAANEDLLRVNEQLEISNLRLKRTNTDLDTFIYTASHDLKAPILNIEALVEGLKEYLSEKNTENDTITQLIGFIEASTIRFKKTIEDLTDVTKIQKIGDQEFILVQIHSLIKEVLLDLQIQIKESNAEIKLGFDENVEVFFPRKSLRSILYNLISNSIKYRDQQRQLVIEINLENIPDFIILSVKDNGLGFNVKKSEKLFAMFGRLHQHVEGTGIGLYIIKRIIENTGGKIEVESEIGIGSVFSVYIKKGI